MISLTWGIYKTKQWANETEWELKLILARGEWGGGGVDKEEGN